MVFDYRLAHRGLANNSTAESRPLLYLTFCRTVRAFPGRLSALLAFSMVNCFLVLFGDFGRGGERLTVQTGGFWPGQWFTDAENFPAEHLLP